MWNRDKENFQARLLKGVLEYTHFFEYMYYWIFVYVLFYLKSQ